MLLSDFKSLGNLSGIETEQFVSYLQDAYEYVINKIRLDIIALPMTFTKACRLDQFNDVATYTGSDSQIAFKEIPTFVRTDQEDDYTEEYDLSVPVIGVTADNGEVPEIYINGSDIVCTNLDSCYVLALGYIYPYLVTTADGYKIDTHYYDLQTMIDLYGFNNLYIDNTLVHLCGLKIMSLLKLDDGSISESSNYDYLLTQLLNMYNEHSESIKFDTYTIDFGVLCH